MTLYRPGETGNARPEAVITAGMKWRSSVTFDASGDLWVTNETRNTTVAYNKTELVKASPVPTVTISGRLAHCMHSTTFATMLTRTRRAHHSGPGGQQRLHALVGLGPGPFTCRGDPARQPIGAGADHSRSSQVLAGQAEQHAR